MSVKKHIERKEFLQYLEKIVTKNISINKENIVIDVPVTKDEFIELQKGNVDKKDYLNIDAYKKISQCAASFLDSIHISQDVATDVMARLSLSYTPKEKYTFMPFLRKSGEPFKFPPPKKDTLYFVAYSIKMHELYDEYIVNSPFNLSVKKVYRFENKNGYGLYSDENLNVCNDTYNECHPYPQDDNNFYNFFRKSREEYDVPQYSKKWFFGFASIEDARLWLNGSLTQDITGEYYSVKEHFQLKEIYVPEPFVIEGNHQVIFRNEYVINKKVLNFELVNIYREKEDTHRIHF